MRLDIFALALIKGSYFLTSWPRVERVGSTYLVGSILIWTFDIIINIETRIQDIPQDHPLEIFSRGERLGRRWSFCMTLRWDFFDFNGRPVVTPYICSTGAGDRSWGIIRSVSSAFDLSDSKCDRSLLALRLVISSSNPKFSILNLPKFSIPNFLPNMILPLKRRVR